MNRRSKIERPEFDYTKQNDPMYVAAYNSQVKQYIQSNKAKAQRRRNRTQEAITAMDVQGGGAPQSPEKIAARKYLKQVGTEGEVYRAIKYLVKRGYEVPPNADPNIIMRKAYKLAIDDSKEIKPSTVAEKVAQVEANAKKMKRLREIKAMKQRQRQRPQASRSYEEQEDDPGIAAVAQRMREDDPSAYNW